MVPIYGIMENSPYVHVRIPGRGRATLSLPGVSRALQSGRLGRNAEAWLDPVGAWIPMQRHPVLAPIVTDQELVIERFSAEHLIVSELVEAKPEPMVSRMLVAGRTLEREEESAIESDWDHEEFDLGPLTMITADDSPLSPDLAQFVERYSPNQERREAVRTSRPVRMSGATQASPWRMGVTAVQRWASSL